MLLTPTISILYEKARQERIASTDALEILISSLALFHFAKVSVLKKIATEALLKRKRLIAAKQVYRAKLKYSAVCGVCFKEIPAFTIGYLPTRTGVSAVCSSEKNCVSSIVGQTFSSEFKREMRYLYENYEGAEEALEEYFE